MGLKYEILEDAVAYSGRELRSGWVEEKTGLGGDAAVGFVGPCSVATDDLVDMDDARAGATIESAEMAHVIVEHAGCSLEACVLRQRLLVCILREILAEKRIDVRRDGDDLYWDDRKLTVSIAAPSKKSSLIHLGINVRPEGAPVPAVGLAELGVGARELLAELLARYKEELQTASHAQAKVKTVD